MRFVVLLQMTDKDLCLIAEVDAANDIDAAKKATDKARNITDMSNLTGDIAVKVLEGDVSVN